MDYNKSIIVGNLTRDPDLRKMPSGDSVCNIAVATNRMWKDKSGEKQQEVEYHNVVIFGKMAEVTAQYMTKGSEVLVEGRLKTSSWETDGVKKYRTEIIAENVRFGSKRDGGGNQSNNQNQAPEPQQSGGNEIDVENIPF